MGLRKFRARIPTVMHMNKISTLHAYSILGYIVLLSFSLQAETLSSVKVVGVPGLKENTSKIPRHLQSLGFQQHEYTIVRFSDVDEQGKWTSRLSHVGQLGDVQQLSKELAKHAGAEINIVGESRGAATSINWDAVCTDSERLSVKTIVAEASFTSMQDLPPKELKYFRNLPDNLKAQFICKGLPKIHKGFPLYDPSGLHPIESIKRGKTPLLLVTSEHDPIVHAAHPKKLYKEACRAGRTNVHLLVVKGDKHTGNLCDEHVQQAVHAFWKAYGGPHDPALAEKGEALYATTQPAIIKDRPALWLRLLKKD